MTVAEFYGGVEYSVTQFAVQLTKEIEEKIAKRELYYKEQIHRYLDRRATFFIQSLTLSPAVLAVMKKEIITHVLFKLKPLIKQRTIFQVIK